MFRIGIDLGGTKIELIALAADGTARLRRRIPTPVGDYMGTVMAIAGLVEDAEVELGVRGSVGVGIPGTESRENGKIKNANSTCLIGQPFRRDLQTVLQREIRLANDANCFALSEAVDGAAAGAEVVFGVILGTGVGGGVVVRGQVLTGPNGIAGEWGHNPLSQPQEVDFPLPACYCGRFGCIETYLSGPAMAAEYAQCVGLPSETGPNSRKIVDAAAAGDINAQVILDRYAARLARALAGVINVLDPDVIVLGGGLSRMEYLYDAVPRLWGEGVFSDTVRTQLRRPMHGDSSGVRGAAWLWNR